MRITVEDTFGRRVILDDGEPADDGAAAFIRGLTVAEVEAAMLAGGLDEGPAQAVLDYLLAKVTSQETC